jgi:Fe-S-cluster containining protein
MNTPNAVLDVEVELADMKHCHPDDFDCQKCGACCVNNTDHEGFAVLDQVEVGRMKRLGLPIAKGLGDDGLADALASRPYSGEGGERICVAFAGEVGGSCGCSIHADRPAVCREFEPGSLQCRAARFAAGLGEDPLVPLRAAIAALMHVPVNGGSQGSA